MADGRKEFFEHMRSAPFTAHQFVQAIHNRFDRRNDVDVHYAKVPDLRLRVFWENSKGKHDEQNFARFIWQSRKEVFYCETYIEPKELASLGFKGAKAHKNGPLLSQIRVGEQYWESGEAQAIFFRTLDFACVRMTQSR